MAGTGEAENNGNGAAPPNQRPITNGNTSNNVGGGNRNRTNDTNNENIPRRQNSYSQGFQEENEKLTTLMLKGERKQREQFVTFKRSIQ